MKKLIIIFTLIFVGVINSASLSTSIYVSSITQGSTETASYIRVICKNGAQYEFLYPDVDNPKNTESYAKSILAQLYYASSNNLALQFFVNGSDGVFLKIKQLKIL